MWHSSSPSNAPLQYSIPLLHSRHSSPPNSHSHCSPWPNMCTLHSYWLWTFYLHSPLTLSQYQLLQHSTVITFGIISCAGTLLVSSYLFKSSLYCFVCDLMPWAMYFIRNLGDFMNNTFTCPIRSQHLLQLWSKCIFIPLFLYIPRKINVNKHIFSPSLSFSPFFLFSLFFISLLRSSPKLIANWL